MTVRSSRQWRVARCTDCEFTQRVNVSGRWVQCCSCADLQPRQAGRYLRDQRCRCGGRLRSYRLRDVNCHRCGKARLKALTAHVWSHPMRGRPGSARI